ncbi:MAG TPA: DUF4922 domain-containing protein, partial [Planctomycetes bacterium]|nr:DUF4922 domain-containing protein [Planctomycetota bacterium]
MERITPWPFGSRGSIGSAAFGSPSTSAGAGKEIPTPTWTRPTWRGSTSTRTAFGPRRSGPGGGSGPMAGEVGPALWERALALQKAQVRSWPALARGHEALREALWREWKIDGWTVKAQCNQARAASNKAKVDPRAVQERPCFLCAENRPSEQEALEWGEEWWILANPAPLFSHHFTVTLKRHGREHILGKLDAFLRLARDLSPGLSVFYNGPRSGASAPDHFHFQAYTAGSLPIEEEAMGPEGPGRGVLARAASGGASAAVVEAAGRAFLLVRGEAFDRILSVLRNSIARLGGESGNEDPWA